MSLTENSQLGSYIGSNSNSSNSSGKNKDKYSSKTDYDTQINKMKAENDLLRSLLANNKDANLENYLSDKEKTTLNNLNTLSNKLTEQSAFVKDVLNQPVRNIIHNWSATHQDILYDTIDLFSNSNIVDNVKNTNKWWGPIGKILKDLLYIFTGGERMFYMGMTVLFIGLIFVFVNITH